VLYQHPSVRQAAVIGVPDGLGHELVQAQVVLKRGSQPVSDRQLIDFAEMHLPGYKVPHQIIFTKSLPCGPTGKIDRKTLRESVISLLHGPG
jgi:long-chain acyl-CoA synthetase